MSKSDDTKSGVLARLKAKLFPGSKDKAQSLDLSSSATSSQSTVDPPQPPPGDPDP